MIRKIFQDNKGENNPKEMYKTITALADVKELTKFITPGESFVIPNPQAKQV